MSIEDHPLEKEAYSITTEEAKNNAIKLLCDKKIHFRTNCRWLRIFDPFGGGGGLTIGNWVFFRDINPSFEMVGHEYVHILQYRKYGFIGFMGRYIAGLISLMFGRSK